MFNTNTYKVRYTCTWNKQRIGLYFSKPKKKISFFNYSIDINIMKCNFLPCFVQNKYS